MSTNVNVKWMKGMAFNADVNGHTIGFDADPSFGGQDKGPRPKAMVLGALGGCSGMDVVSMLEKMRVPIEDFEMKIEGFPTEEHPKIYHTVHMTYIFTGKSLPMEKLERAVNLSQEKYCGVNAMLKGVVKIEYTIKVKEL